MPGFGPSADHPDAAPEPAVVDRDAAAAMANEFYRDGMQVGREQADWEIAGALLDRNREARAPVAAAQERAAYGPGGRAHFADPRPEDFPGRRNEPGPEPEQELEAEAG